jgi:hypothetical protein
LDCKRNLEKLPFRKNTSVRFFLREFNITPVDFGEVSPPYRFKESP